MNKSGLIKEIAATTHLTQQQADAALTALMEAVSVTLVKNDKVLLVGFGTFEVSERAARSGRNPATGEEMQILATRLPKFKAGKVLKEAIAESKALDKPVIKTEVETTVKPKVSKSESKPKKVAKK